MQLLCQRMQFLPHDVDHTVVVSLSSCCLKSLTFWLGTGGHTGNSGWHSGPTASTTTRPPHRLLPSGTLLRLCRTKLGEFPNKSCHQWLIPPSDSFILSPSSQLCTWKVAQNELPLADITLAGLPAVSCAKTNWRDCIVTGRVGAGWMSYVKDGTFLLGDVVIVLA